METAEQYRAGGATYITEVNPGPDNYKQEQDHADLDSDQEEKSNQKIFNVDEAVPPTDYDAPYSAIPENVVLKKVKQKVKKSYIKIAKKKADEMAAKLAKQKESHERIQKDRAEKAALLL